MTERERKRIAALYREGLKVHEIAAATGRAFGTVAGVIADMHRSGDLERRLPGRRREPVPVPRDFAA